MITIYLIRHSQPFRQLLGEYNANEIEQIRNEKNPLSVDGEKYAEQMSNYSELLNIDSLYSSHYVRAMATAKYIAEKNNILLNVDERLGERKFGVNNISELPETFFEDQFRNWNYKLPNGESADEISKRMNEVLLEILSNNKDKNVAIIPNAKLISEDRTNSVVARKEFTKNDINSKIIDLLKNVNDSELKSKIIELL